MSDLSLNLIVLYVADLEQAYRFYKAFGLEFVTEQHGNGAVHYACELGKVVLELYPLKTNSDRDKEITNITRLGFNTKSLDVTLQRLEEDQWLSSNLIRKTSRSLLVRDPDGRLVEITEKL